MTNRRDPDEAVADVLADRLLTVEEVADLLAVSPATLLTWRSRGPERGPRAIKIGHGIVRWRRGDVRSWVAAHAEDLDALREQGGDDE